MNIIDQARTSISSPLQIAEITIPETNGVIGMTICPGKKGHSAFGGYWDRDLEIDMQTVAAWQPDIVVTLMEEDELKKYHVAELGLAVEKYGMDWHHLPIPDVDTPKDIFLARWGYSGMRIRNLLRSGHRVLLHCRGGLGRTGIVAAQLLVELGWNHDRTVQEVRQQRPGAIETIDQEEYVLGLQKLSYHFDKLASRVYGCLFGGALGDALGYIVEFYDYELIIRTFGPQGITDPVSAEQAVVSDDTQMTLFTLEGLCRAVLANKDIIEEIKHAYLDWYDTQQTSHSADIYGRLAKSSALQATRSPGNTCLSALEAGGWGTLENPINNSKGCGTVMRVAPVGLFSAGLDEKKVFAIAGRSGAVTHGHVTAALAAGAMALIIRKLVTDTNLPEAVADSLDMLSRYPGHEETSTALQKAVKAAAEDNPDHEAVINTLWGDSRNKEKNSLGWIAEEALAIGVYAALKGNNFCEVIRIAANHSGDTDSTASVAGQLYGAWQGINEIPHKWIRRLDVFDDIMQCTSACWDTICNRSSHLSKSSLNRSI